MIIPPDVLFEMMEKTGKSMEQIVKEEQERLEREAREED